MGEKTFWFLIFLDKNFSGFKYFWFQRKKNDDDNKMAFNAVKPIFKELKKNICRFSIGEKQKAKKKSWQKEKRKLFSIFVFSKNNLFYPVKFDYFFSIFFLCTNNGKQKKTLSSLSSSTDINFNARNMKNMKTSDYKSSDLISVNESQIKKRRKRNETKSNHCLNWLFYVCFEIGIQIHTLCVIVFVYVCKTNWTRKNFQLFLIQGTHCIHAN